MEMQQKVCDVTSGPMKKRLIRNENSCSCIGIGQTKVLKITSVHIRMFMSALQWLVVHDPISQCKSSMQASYFVGFCNNQGQINQIIYIFQISSDIRIFIYFTVWLIFVAVNDVTLFLLYFSRKPFVIEAWFFDQFFFTKARNFALHKLCRSYNTPCLQFCLNI